MTSTRISILDVADRDFLHEASLGLLQRTGVRFGSRAARDVLREAGCQVDDETGVVRIPRQVADWAISQLRRDVLLAGRDRAHDAVLDGRRTYCTVAGICPSVVDEQTDALRSPTLGDLARLTRIADALDAFGIVWYSVSPTAQLPAKMVDLEALWCMLQNTTKHVMGQVVRAAEVPYALEILELCADFGSPALHPLFSAIYCPVAPLQHDGDATEAAMELARSFVPVDIFSLGLAGATAPATLAGTIVQTNCEVLSAVVLLQHVAPGCPLIYSANASVMDMRNAKFAVSTPETILMNIAQIELAHSYNMPALSVGFVSDAESLDFRAGIEDIAFALPTRLAQPDIMTGLGTVLAGQAVSYPKMMLDAELVGYIERVACGIAVDDEHVAADLIGSVGPGGQYLSQKATTTALRQGEHWMPSLFDRARVAGAQDASLVEDAKSKACELLAAHEVAGVKSQVASQVAAVLSRAEAELPD